MELVGDTSGLVSFGILAQREKGPFELCLDRYEVIVPERVVAELRETASYDDVHGRGATAVLNECEALRVESTSLEPTFPLDDGENAAVQVANESSAALLLCDEFTQLGVIHASLADTRLVTTPTLLSAFVEQERLSPTAAVESLETVAEARSWDANSYVQRVRTRLGDD